jgi:hypothetical protein
VDFAFKPPALMLVVFIAVVVVAVAALLLKKMPRWRKIAGISIVVVGCGALTFFLYRTTHLVVDDQGIHADTYGRQAIAWSGVQKAFVVQDLGSSQYAPVMKTNGTSLGTVRRGWFKLANGTTAFVTVEIRDRGLVIETAGTTYVFAPREFDLFREEVGRHITVDTAAGGAP